MPEVLSIEVDEEFDPRPPVQPFGLRGPDGKPNIALISGIIVALLLVLALIFVVTNPFGAEKKVDAAPTYNPVDPLKDLKALPTYAPDAQIIGDLQNSLDDWARFQTSGDIRLLEDSFDVTGNQFRLLLNGRPATETQEALLSAQELFASPPGGEPAKIEIGTAGNAGKKGSLYTVRTQITWTEIGAEPRTFNWDITMKKSSNDSTYILNTIATTEVGKAGGLAFCEAAKIVENLENDETVSNKLAKLTTLGEKITSVEKLLKIRLATWQYVEAAFVNSNAGGAVPIIIDQYEQNVEMLKEAETLDMFFENVKLVNEDMSVIDAHVQVEEAARSECADDDIDISGR